MAPESDDCAQVTVAVTPDGKADSVARLGEAEVFALPAEESMSVQELFDGLRDTTGSTVMYAQAQNNR